MASRAESIANDEPGRSFEEEWPELARQLDRFLAFKGVEQWLRADVIQETATRLYPRWRSLDHSRPLWNLVATIALRVVHNHRRTESRIQLVADPVAIHGDDVDARGVQRAQLDKTRSALRKLNADQRRVLLAEVGEAALPDGTRNRINVLRLRARARLREVLGPWAPAAVTLRLRHLRTHLAQKRVPLEMNVPAMVNSIANVAMVTTIGLAGAVGSGADGANSAPPARARSMPSASAHDLHLDAVKNGGHPEPARVSRSEGGAENAGDGISGPAAASRRGIDGHKQWADRRQQEVRQLADDGGRLGEDGAQLAKEGARLGDDARREGERQASHRQEEAADRREEVEDRAEEVKDLLT